MTTQMKVKTDLLVLIERCESAVGPDRILNSDIARLLWHGIAYAASDRAWNFTGSLDAAMTLVPEGWAFDLVQQLPPTGSTARVYSAQGQVTDLCYGNTPALALCAAALHAKVAASDAPTLPTTPPEQSPDRGTNGQ